MLRFSPALPVARTALLAALAVPLGAQTTADYPIVDNVGGSYVNLATFPIRALMRHPTTTHLWAVNHANSTVERFVPGSSEPADVFGVPWDPVSIAYWSGGQSGNEEILVVCRGSWCVVGLDPASGRIVRCLQLNPRDALGESMGRMAEPGDILVDDVGGRAFVSCTGGDSVIQIDLTATQNEIVRVFHRDDDPDFLCKSPLFLSWNADKSKVLVAPMHSGNNSFADGLNIAVTLEVLDGETFDVGLPDEDLFEITPYTDAANPGSVAVAAKGMGTILFGHGWNEATDEFWQLGIESLNKLPNPQNEPELNGVFVENQLVILDDAFGPTTEPDPGDIKSLDFLGSAPNAIGQPYGLDFDSLGNAYITGVLTDNLTVLDSNGAFKLQVELPEGAIPRTPVVLDLGASPYKSVSVLCQGTNEIVTYVVDVVNDTVIPRTTYELSHDPTPPAVAAGREIFYDGHNSLNDNLSCASCHIEGGSDFLAWNLSNIPVEEKGPMVTQTLVGLERLAPFHWRGERELSDFNGAFAGLLGGAELDDDFVSVETGETQLGAFEAFIFSLRNPANPYQNRERVLDSTIEAEVTSFFAGEPHNFDYLHTTDGAVQGRIDFEAPDSFNVLPLACASCHALPTGTRNQINIEQPDQRRPRRVQMKAAPFHELWRKNGPVTVLKEDANDPNTWLYRGAVTPGFTHQGSSGDLFRFVQLLTPTEQSASNITDFVFQADQGLAPAVHFAFHLRPGGPAFSSQEVTYLQGERDDLDCDIVVIGQSIGSSGALENLRWTWDASAAAYVCEDPGVASRQYSDFRAGVLQQESNVFLGVPRGMGTRFAIDYDLDGLRNLDSAETEPLVPDPVDNGSAPGFVAGGEPEIPWQSSRAARVQFTTDEPTIATVTATSSTGEVITTSTDVYSYSHMLMLTGLRPSTGQELAGYEQPPVENVTYTVVAEVTDRFGNTASQATAMPLRTEDFFVFTLPPPSNPGNLDQILRTHTLSELTMTTPSVQPGGLFEAEVAATASMLRGKWAIPAGGSDYESRRAADRVVVGRVLVKRAATGHFEVADDQGLNVTPGVDAFVADSVEVTGGGPLLGVPGGGPYLVSRFRSGADGVVKLTFQIDPVSQNGSAFDLQMGDRLVFNVEAVVEVTTDPGPPSGIGVVTFSCQTTRALNQWSFPDSMDHASTVESSPLP